MNTLLNLFSIVMFVTCFRVSEQNEHSLKTGFQTFEKDIDVFSTGLAIADFLDNQELDSGLTGEDREKLKDDILQKIAKMLETSETNTILALTLQEEVGRLRDTVSVVRSSLADLDYYLKAENGANELKYKDLFLKRFVEHGVIIEIRKLPDLLTDTAPGLPKPLKSVVLDTTECNMTSVVEFEQVYANLISKAVTLQLVYTKFTELNLDYVKDYWDNLLPGVQNTFDDMENVCIDKFEESVSREIIEDVPVEKLHNNNKERYNWKWNDVFQYQPVASSKWHYFVSPPRKLNSLGLKMYLCFR